MFFIIFQSPLHFTQISPASNLPFFCFVTEGNISESLSLKPSLDKPVLGPLLCFYTYPIFTPSLPFLGPSPFSWHSSIQWLLYKRTLAPKPLVSHDHQDKANASKSLTKPLVQPQVLFSAPSPNFPIPPRSCPYLLQLWMLFLIIHIYGTSNHLYFISLVHFIFHPRLPLPVWLGSLLPLHTPGLKATHLYPCSRILWLVLLQTCSLSVSNRI